MKRAFSTARRLPILLPFSLAFAFLGCLVSETTQFTITLNDDGKSGTIVTIMRNIESEETDGERQSGDFDEAIRAWKGDDYLLERMNDGLYVKGRALSLDGDALEWKETALFSDLAQVFKREFRNDTLRIAISPDQKIVSTNGTVLKANDSTIVFWAVSGAKQISLTTKADSFSTNSHFASRFRQYLKVHQE